MKKNNWVAPLSEGYLLSPAADWLCAGGLSFTVYLIFLAIPSQVLASINPNVVKAATFLAFIGNWPHFAATNYRLYSRKENIYKFPLTALAIPLLTLAGIIMALYDADGFGRWFVKVFLIWSPYHYSGQTYGLCLMYGMRTGFSIEARLKRLIWLFIYSSYLYYVSKTENSEMQSNFEGVYFPKFALPFWLPKIFLIVWCVLGISVLVSLLLHIRKNKKPIPLLMLLPIMTQVLWFGFGSLNSALLFFILVPFFHSLQYLYVAGATQIRASRHFSKTNTFYRWVTLNVIGGVGLFWVLPKLALVSGLIENIAHPIIVASINMHHFFVDGVVWKLRDPRLKSLSPVERIQGEEFK